MAYLASTSPNLGHPGWLFLRISWVSIEGEIILLSTAKNYVEGWDVKPSCGALELSHL